jgi:DNA-directed RNA polymerase specialized sigma24 family protein
MTAHAQISHAHTASFQAIRPRLFDIGYRGLESATDAGDVVQDAWTR